MHLQLKCKLFGKMRFLVVKHSPYADAVAILVPAPGKKGMFLLVKFAEGHALV
ncbi:hypothetical protein AHMF7616_02015 [Adhaeribacter pallidiroseus]|uniref:Uncharacterized protein n=1 Tax=Adhaeribacter pallidiroseus TaxID=2072847 RepID=A0A369QG64_9BACT|nr:hypothetical protein AHMF7616_02015 [Adhaeribacter pallidiroseus]